MESTEIHFKVIKSLVTEIFLSVLSEEFHIASQKVFSPFNLKNICRLTLTFDLPLKGNMTDMYNTSICSTWLVY